MRPVQERKAARRMTGSAVQGKRADPAQTRTVSGVGRSRCPHDDQIGIGKARVAALIGVGALTGVYSGFFGLGGGFVLVPMLTRWLHTPLKRATGTSLATVAVLAIPGSIAHSLLGNVDWAIAAGLTLGVIPGAAIGARLNALTPDRRLRLGFVLLLLVSAFALGASELGLLR